jgi:23S rRNA (cytidine1920-2'-O)/16S rRNA (cytidine1409-2'-O)-methyltransferase
MKERIRIDKLLVERGLAESREKAQAMVMAGEVLAAGQKIDKAGQTVPADVEIRLLSEKPKYVSRAGQMQR